MMEIEFEVLQVHAFTTNEVKIKMLPSIQISFRLIPTSFTYCKLLPLNLDTIE